MRLTFQITQNSILAIYKDQIVGHVDFTLFRYKENPYSRKTQVIALVNKGHVEKALRRNGIRSALNNKLLKMCNVIISGAESKDGEEFMRSFGYEKLQSGFWMYTKPKRKRHKK